MAEEKLVGKIIHYYDKLGVAIVELLDRLEVGQTIHIKGAHDDFTQAVIQMQYEHKDLTEGKPGQQVGIKVGGKVHKNAKVYGLVI